MCKATKVVHEFLVVVVGVCCPHIQENIRMNAQKLHMVCLPCGFPSILINKCTLVSILAS